MKVLSHVVALGVGFGLGIYVAKGGNNPDQNQKAEVQVEPAASPAPAAPAVPSAAPAAQRADLSHAPGTAGPDLTLLRDDFERQMGRGDLQQANLVLLDMQKADPRSQIFLESQGRYLTRKRDHEMARTALKACLAAYPQSKSCMVDLASVELQIGSKEEQAAAIQGCLSAMPTDPQCRNMSAITSMNSGNYEAAVKTYQDLIRDNGSYGFRFNPGMLDWQLGLALEGAGRHSEALDSFEKSCQVNFPEACDKLEDLSGGGID